MRTTNAIFVASFLLAPSIHARDVPPNVQNFYNTVKPGKCTGTDLLKGGFQDADSSDPKGMILAFFWLEVHVLLCWRPPVFDRDEIVALYESTGD